MKFRLRPVLLVVAVAVVSPAVLAFGPSELTEGTLTARITVPETVTDVGKPHPVLVSIRNGGETAVKGSARLNVIDEWTYTPAEAPFAVAPGEEATLAFDVVAGEGSYNVPYPVHAEVAFTSAGATRTVAPVAVIHVNRPSPPGVHYDETWRPIELRPDSALALWQVRTRRVIAFPGGSEPLVMPVGWQGSEPGTSASAVFDQRIPRGDVRPSIAMHPVWKQSRGPIMVEYPLSLPANQPVRMTFAYAIRDTRQGEPASDGVTFRVRASAMDAPAGAQGDIVFEQHSDAKTWQDAEVDLSAYAGKTIRLQLESHAGPANDPTCDQSYWAMPTLIVGVPRPPAPPDATPRALGTAGACDVSVALGSRGLLNADVSFKSNDAPLAFNGFSARVLGQSLEREDSAAYLVDVKDESTDARVRVRHTFQVGAEQFDLMGELWTEPAALMARFWLENAPEPRPWHVAYIEDIAAGPWTDAVKRVYLGVGNVIEEPGSFQLNFEGHRMATSFVGYDFANGASLVQAVDVPPSHINVDPDKKLCALHIAHDQQQAFIPAVSVWEGAKTWRDLDERPAASGVKVAAGRFTFDLWGGDFAKSAERFRRAFAYGMTDALVVWHRWQRWGYDIRLPDIYPPDSELGGLDAFVDLVRTCQDAGVRFAPHDNYIDFYADADGYSYSLIGFTPEGRPIPAWFMPSTKDQSYRWRADKIEPFVKRNLELIRENISPDAYFIDVWSSAPPYDYWTEDGQFFSRIYTRDVHRETFAWIREFLGNDAPQISEAGHDQLIGWLDGAQTNHLRIAREPLPPGTWTAWTIPCKDAERIPWIDVAYHDRFALQGAGYSSRYAGGLDQALHGINSDDYMTSEVMTGHCPMVSSVFGRDEVRKYWLLQGIARALALQRIEGVEFVDDNIHRQRIAWENGAVVLINRDKEDWQTGGLLLPQFSFHVSAPVAAGVAEAAIERKDGVIVEWAQSPEMLYVNARPAAAVKARDAEDLRLARMNPDNLAVAFGPVTTDGGARLAHDGSALVVTPLPEGEAFTVALDWPNLPWRLPKAVVAVAVDEAGEELSRTPLGWDGDTATLICEEGVFQYRLVAE